MKILLALLLAYSASLAIANEPLLLYNSTGDRASFDQMREALKETGGHAQHAYIPYFLAGRIAPEHLMALPATVEIVTLLNCWTGLRP